MKLITLLPFCLLFVFNSFASNYAFADTRPQNISKYSKEQFLSEFGKDETSEKIISYYFFRSKKEKNRTYGFSALTLVGTIYGIYLLSGPPNTYGYFTGIFALLFAISFLYGLIEAIINCRKYSPQNLYKQLIDYQAGNPLPKKLNRQIKYFTEEVAKNENPVCKDEVNNDCVPPFGETDLLASFFILRKEFLCI